MATNVNKINRSALLYVEDLGRGGFSDVYQMTWDSPNGPVSVAAKKLRKKDQHELQVLSGLDHQNIIKLIGVVDENMEFMLILELCEGGSLRSYLKARNGRQLSAKQFYEFAEQAARPLEYLRENKWIHKDVKSPNYMVTSQNTLKLGDFGLAKNIDQTIFSATLAASYRWMAPELLVKGVLSPKYDIFALAVVLWELWTGRFPWEGVQNQTIVYKVCNNNERLPIPEDSPEPFKDLLKQCWQKDWKYRPDIIQVLQVITSLAAAAAQKDRQRQIVTGPWEMVKEFGRQDGSGKLKLAYHMTLSPGGDVVIADHLALKIKVYTIGGEYKSSICIRRHPWQIAVSSDNTCFVTDFTQHITMYELDGKHKGSWESSCPSPSLASRLLSPLTSPHAPELCGLAIDHAGDLLLGDLTNKYIYKHQQDGTHVANIKVGIEPWYIAVTSQGTIVTADVLTVPQVISSTGQMLYTLKHPGGKSKWHPLNVYCHDGIIFVCNSDSILCYSESGKYLGSVPIPSSYFHGLAMTSDSKTLLVCDSNLVKVYTTSTVRQSSLFATQTLSNTI